MAKRSVEAMMDFLSPVSLVPGMGPRRVEALQESGIETIGELLYTFPRRYIDRSVVVPLNMIGDYLDKSCSVSGTVKRVRLERGRRQKFRVLIEDGTGQIELLWFQGTGYLRNAFEPGMKLMVTGKVSRYIHYQMVHPMADKVPEVGGQAVVKYVPVYSLTSAMREAGLAQGLFRKAVLWILKNLRHYPRVLPEQLESRLQFPPLEKCIRELHFPSSMEGFSLYRQRIKYEEFYRVVLSLRFSKRKFEMPGRSMKAGELPELFRKTLPFQLTDDQKKAIDILYRDGCKPDRMHRLLQGDVGCGKTLVAFFSCLPALNEGLQVAWMAPTEVLAAQSHLVTSKYLSVLGIESAILTGGTPAAQRREILRKLCTGELRFLTGTHSLLQPSVKFKSLGMVVIDEQHKFGVKQRIALQEKDPASDFLLMSATPIPQTLAMTLYGDLDIVTIARGPGGRKPVSTFMVPEVKRPQMEAFVNDHIVNKGASVFWVAPRIERDDEFEDGEDEIKDALTLFKNLTSGVFRDVRSGLVHGRLSSEEKRSVMNEFTEGKTKLLVSTSVVEVGIDVPCATVIVIENADLFGLAQLHQLRGRVGRGGGESFCFLLCSAGASSEATERLRAFCKLNDGFKIAEMDLRYRGPGEMAGMRQSGWGDQVLAEILDDTDLFREVQGEIGRLLGDN